MAFEKDWDALVLFSGMNFHESLKQHAPSFTKTINVLMFLWPALNRRDANIFLAFFAGYFSLGSLVHINIIGDISLCTAKIVSVHRPETFITCFLKMATLTGPSVVGGYTGKRKSSPQK